MTAPVSPVEASPVKCANERESWTCPNMLGVEGDTDMDYERYECKVCGRRMKLDYEEMR